MYSDPFVIGSNAFFVVKNWYIVFSRIFGFLGAHIHQICAHSLHAQNKGLKFHSVLSLLDYLQLYWFHPCIHSGCLRRKFSQYSHLYHIDIILDQGQVVSQNIYWSTDIRRIRYVFKDTPVLSGGRSVSSSFRYETFDWSSDGTWHGLFLYFIF